MTDIEEFHRMLDKRGIAWYEVGDTTFFGVSNYDCHYAANEFIECGLTVNPLTPEQVVAVTMGRGTCRNAAPEYLDFLCSECGFMHYHSDENDDGEGNDWSYCPRCGAEVIE